MTSPEVRAAVEAAIRRRLAGRRAAPEAAGAGAAAPSSRAEEGDRLVNACHAPDDGVQPSAGVDDRGHGRFPRAALPGDPPAGRCVIEPEVECVGSGYCRSRGY